MICPASTVRYCGEFASHSESMYFHLLRDHTPEEVALALLAFGSTVVEPKRILSSEITEGADKSVTRLEEQFKESIKGYQRRKVTSLKGYLEYCPDCGEKYTVQCRCMMADRTCPNGHNWHHHQQPHSRGPLPYRGEGLHNGECSAELCELIETKRASES